MIKPREKIVESDFRKLIGQRCKPFPKVGFVDDVPDKQGVYVIYSPRNGRVVHVGRTYRGKKGLRQRLRNHLQGASSFTKEFLKGDGSRLRRGYEFQYLTLSPWRRRALLEFYATGILCPLHLGKHRHKRKRLQK